MSAVYRATNTKLNRDVAIKVLPAAFANDIGRMQRFSREAQVLAALNHPNIAGIYGIEEGELVMELVDGETLHGPVPVETAIEYACRIAMGLEAAHEKGIVHRDLINRAFAGGYLIPADPNEAPRPRGTISIGPSTKRRRSSARPCAPHLSPGFPLADLRPA